MRPRYASHAAALRAPFSAHALEVSYPRARPAQAAAKRWDWRFNAITVSHNSSPSNTLGSKPNSSSTPEAILATAPAKAGSTTGVPRVESLTPRSCSSCLYMLLWYERLVTIRGAYGQDIDV